MKIGRTQDLGRRLYTLRKCEPQVFCIIETNCAPELESTLHWVFTPYHRSCDEGTEWYDLQGSPLIARLEEGAWDVNYFRLCYEAMTTPGFDTRLVKRCRVYAHDYYTRSEP